MSQDVTLFFEDIAIGYYAYRSVDPNRFLTAIVPTAEAHLNIPLNHRGYGTSDLAGTPDILDMTFGTNVEFRKRAILTAAYVTPGHRPQAVQFGTGRAPERPTSAGRGGTSRRSTRPR